MSNSIKFLAIRQDVDSKLYSCSAIPYQSAGEVQNDNGQAQTRLIGVYPVGLPIGYYETMQQAAQQQGELEAALDEAIELLQSNANVSDALVALYKAAKLCRNDHHQLEPQKATN